MKAQGKWEPTIVQVCSAAGLAILAGMSEEVAGRYFHRAGAFSDGVLMVIVSVVLAAVAVWNLLKVLGFVGPEVGRPSYFYRGTRS